MSISEEIKARLEKQGIRNWTGDNISKVLIERDKQREEDGLPRRIRLGKIIKPGPKGSSQVVIVPTTVEPKFYHDNSITESEEELMGGAGNEKEGDVIGQQNAHQEGEGEGTGVPR